MFLTASAWEEGAFLSRFIAHGHDYIHRRLVCKFLDPFGAIPCCFADVNAQFSQRTDSQRMDTPRMGARAEDFKGRSATGTQQTLRHLGAGGVMGTQKEHAHWLCCRWHVIRHGFPPG